MFVSENSSIKQSSIKLNITTLDGECVAIEVAADTNVDTVKIEAVSQLIDSTESSKLSLYFSLIHVNTGRLINEEQTLRQATVVDNDDLLLLRRKLPVNVVSSQKKENKQLQSVSASDIAAATANLPSCNADRQQLQHAISIDFQTELKKILISLIDVAQKLMCLDPAGYKEAVKYVTIDSPPPPRRDSYCAVDPLVLKRLVDMGFSRRKATKALLVTRMCQDAAVQWLCDNVDSNADDADVTEPGSCESTTVAAATEENADCDTTIPEEKLKLELIKLSQMSSSLKVNRMLAAFKAYKRRVFKPDPHALQSLLEMGFDKSAAIDALRTHNNVKDEACDWLLNHNSDDSEQATVVGAGLDPSSSVYKAIMSSDVIQLALMNPRTLTALLHILENPSFIQQWLRDADLNPMLLQISRIYHTEKYRH